LFQKRIHSIFRGTLVGKRKQTIFKKRWFDITTCYGTLVSTNINIKLLILLEIIAEKR
jgi:hypothetical protein